MEKNKYLNEEKYQKTKNKLILIAFIFLILGILGGVILIFTGNQKGKQNEISVQEKLDDIKSKRTELEKQLADKSYECNSLDMNDPNWFADSSKCTDEETKIRVELGKLNSEEVSLEHQEGPALVYFGLGGMSIFIGLVIFGCIYMTAKRREIAAFGAQQMMPIAQEGIDTIAPTVGNAAKEIVKGVKEGLKDEEK